MALSHPRADAVLADLCRFPDALVDAHIYAIVHEAYPNLDCFVRNGLKPELTYDEETGIPIPHTMEERLIWKFVPSEELLEAMRPPVDESNTRQKVVNLANVLYTEHQGNLSMPKVVAFIRRDVTDASPYYQRCLEARSIAVLTVKNHTGKGRYTEEQFWRGIAKDAQPNRFTRPKKPRDPSAPPGPVAIPDRGWGSSYVS